MGISWQELVLVLVIVLVLFGPKRLPEVGRSLGNGIREFKDSMSGLTKSDPSPPAIEAASRVEVPVAVEVVAEPESVDTVPGR